MIDFQISKFVATIRPALEGNTTKQGFAKALYQAAHPLLVLVRPRDKYEVYQLGEEVKPVLTAHGIDPEKPLGRFVLDRLREAATFPWASPHAYSMAAEVNLVTEAGEDLTTESGEIFILE